MCPTAAPAGATRWETTTTAVEGADTADPSTPATGAPSFTLAALSRAVGDPEVLERFVLDYLRLLETRLTVLQLRLALEDSEATRVAILSLESSSAMIGATDVVVAARALRTAVAQQRADLYQALYERLVAVAAVVRAALEQQGFSCPPAAAPPAGIPPRAPSR